MKCGDITHMVFDFEVPKGQKFSMGYFRVIATNVQLFKIPD